MNTPSDSKTELDRRLWDFCFGLLDEAEATELREWITSDPLAARAYARVAQATDRVAIAAQLPDAPLALRAGRDAATAPAMASSLDACCDPLAQPGLTEAQADPAPASSATTVSQIASTATPATAPGWLHWSGPLLTAALLAWLLVAWQLPLVAIPPGEVASRTPSLELDETPVRLAELGAISNRNGAAMKETRSGEVARTVRPAVSISLHGNEDSYTDAKDVPHRADLPLDPAAFTQSGEPQPTVPRSTDSNAGGDYLQRGAVTWMYRDWRKEAWSDSSSLTFVEAVDAPRDQAKGYYFRTVTLDRLSLRPAVRLDVAYEVLNSASEIDGLQTADGTLVQGATEWGVGNGSTSADFGDLDRDHWLLVQTRSWEFDQEDDEKLEAKKSGALGLERRRLERGIQSSRTDLAAKLPALTFAVTPAGEPAATPAPAEPQPAARPVAPVKPATPELLAVRPKPTQPQVTFYPEGGELVAGVPQRVYFHAADGQGEPLAVKGRVVDGKGAVVAAATTDAKNGRGWFRLNGKADETYALQIDQPAVANVEFDDATLPRATRGPVALEAAPAVTPEGSPVRMRLYATEDRIPLKLVAVCRGREVGAADVTTSPLAAGATQGSTSLDVELPLAEEASGLVRVTAFDTRFDPPLPRAERLCYRRPATYFDVEFVEREREFAAGEEVKLQIAVKDEQGQPAKAALGIEVAAVKESGVESARADESLEGFFLLFEEQNQTWLRDVPSALLAGTPEANGELDLRLATDGWRRFAAAPTRLARAEKYAQLGDAYKLAEFPPAGGLDVRPAGEAPQGGDTIVPVAGRPVPIVVATKEIADQPTSGPIGGGSGGFGEPAGEGKPTTSGGAGPNDSRLLGEVGPATVGQSPGRPLADDHLAVDDRRLAYDNDGPLVVDRTVNEYYSRDGEQAAREGWLIVSDDSGSLAAGDSRAWMWSAFGWASMAAGALVVCGAVGLIWRERSALPYWTPAIGAGLACVAIGVSWSGGFDAWAKERQVAFGNSSTSTAPAERPEELHRDVAQTREQNAPTATNKLFTLPTTAQDDRELGGRGIEPQQQGGIGGGGDGGATQPGAGPSGPASSVTVHATDRESREFDSLYDWERVHSAHADGQDSTTTQYFRYLPSGKDATANGRFSGGKELEELSDERATIEQGLRRFGRKYSSASHHFGLEGRKSAEQLRELEGFGYTASKLPIESYTWSEPPGQAAPPSGLVYWNPLVVTGDDGRATIQFTLPRAPANYRVRVDAHGDGRLGHGEMVLRGEK